jgi:hypothetical protein
VCLDADSEQTRIGPQMGATGDEISESCSESPMGMYAGANATENSPTTTMEDGENAPATTGFGRRVGVSRVELQEHS